MADLPHTYTDINGARLTVADGLLGLVAEGEGTIYTHTPTGEDAVAVARAVLAAAGDTGHEVVRTDEIDAYRARSARGFELTCEVRKLTAERDAAFEEGARSMRDRADDTVAQHWPRPGDERPSALVCADVRGAIRSLPPEDEEGEPCRASSTGAFPDLPYECELAVGHAGSHRAQMAPLEWGDDPDRCCGGQCSNSEADEAPLVRLAALEDLVADQADAIEHQSRDIESLRAAMGNAQAAIRGLGRRFTAEEDG